MFEMDDIRARLLAATAVTVVAQEMKNTPGEFERSMPRTMTPVVGYVRVLLSVIPSTAYCSLTGG